MSTEAPKYSVLERVLAYTASSIIVIAVASYLTTLIIGLAGGRHLLAAGVWPFVTWVAFYGLPIGFILLIVLLAINFSRRGSRRKDRE
jgi:hypothetical protein